ncbi:hypothetical protein M3Y97_01077900 [Aphelenchoides bicaudatus]|nr:hypothetical protein M3Y97_01077900 [Aphelenchoides bicaudatus]
MYPALPQPNGQYMPCLQVPSYPYNSHSQPGSGRSSPVHNEQLAYGWRQPFDWNQQPTNQNNNLNVYPQAPMSRSTPDLSNYHPCPKCQCPQSQCSHQNENKSKAKKLLELGKKLPFGKIAKGIFSHVGKRKGHVGASTYSNNNSDYNTGNQDSQNDTNNLNNTDNYNSTDNQSPDQTYAQNEESNQEFFEAVDDILTGDSGNDTGATDSGNSNDNSGGGDSGGGDSGACC